MNPCKRAVGPREQIERALMIRKTLGVRCAASYMRRRGYSLEAALWLLVYRT